MELIILTGIQGAGKSTFFQRHFVDTHIRVNLDMLKTRNKERLLISACFGMQHSLVIDNTNVTPEERQVYITWAKLFKYEVHGYYFDVPVEECIERNKNKAKPVPMIAIHATDNRLRRPEYKEGFDQLYYVKADGEISLIPNFVEDR